MRLKCAVSSWGLTIAICDNFQQFCKMTEAQKKEFLIIFLTENLDISTNTGRARLREIAKRESMTEEILTDLFVSNSSDIKRIKRLYVAKRDRKDDAWMGSSESFYRWYLGQSKKCHYCGVSEEQVREYFRNNPSRGGRRGQHLEIERKEPKDRYSPANCVLACYVCNNAKSDFISEQDFGPIAEGIIKFWKKE